MSDWKIVSFDDWERRSEKQPLKQDGEVNWKVEKIEKKEEDTTRPMLTIKQARDSYMAKALQMKSSIAHREILSHGWKRRRRREGQPEEQWQKGNWETEKEDNKDTSRQEFAIKQTQDSYMTEAIQCISTTLRRLKDSFTVRKRMCQDWAAPKAL